MDFLVQGYARFRADVYPQQKPLFEKLAAGQQPQALFLTCSDSRVVPDMILQTRPGDLFICRNAASCLRTERCWAVSRQPSSMQYVFSKCPTSSSAGIPIAAR